MKSHFTYTCPNHSGVGVIDYLIFLNMVEPYHNRKMVTVNETAYKSVKKTLTMKIMSIRARHVRAP